MCGTKFRKRLQMCPVIDLIPSIDNSRNSLRIQQINSSLTCRSHFPERSIVKGSLLSENNIVNNRIVLGRNFSTQEITCQKCAAGQKTSYFCTHRSVK